jgi:hypothetical protein
MATDSTLTTTSNSGSQTTTASPQTSASGGGGYTTPAAQTDNLQPVSTTSLLDGQGGVTLNPNVPLTTVALSSTTTASTGVPSKPPTHQTHPIVLGFVALLVIVAVAILLQQNSAAKNTTEN